MNEGYRVGKSLGRARIRAASALSRSGIAAYANEGEGNELLRERKAQ